MYHINNTRDATQYKYITKFKWVIEPVIFSTYSLSIYLNRFFSLYVDLITNVYFSFPRSCHIISKTNYFNNNFYEYLFTNTQIMHKTSLPMYGQHGVVHLLLSMLWQWYIWRRSCTTERNPSCQIRHNARWWGIEKCFLLLFLSFLVPGHSVHFQKYLTIIPMLLSHWINSEKNCGCSGKLCLGKSL